MKKYKKPKKNLSKYQKIALNAIYAISVEDKKFVSFKKIFKYATDYYNFETPEQSKKIFKAQLTRLENNNIICKKKIHLN